MPDRLAVTGVGLVSALGTDPRSVFEAIRAGATAIRDRSDTDLRHLADPRAAIVDDLDVRPFLKRRKDGKLLARASELVLPAAARALEGWPGDRLELGLFVAVGREPPDDGESEASLVASERDGRLDEALLAGVGRDRYPPLLPLKTLPNMALAHVSINLGVGGANGAWAGGAEAGLTTFWSGFRAVSEGRAPAALVGGADSLTHAGLQRDRLRLGASDPPGEGAAFVLLEPVGGPRPALATVSRAIDQDVPEVGTIHKALGACGAAEVAIRLVLALASGSRPIRIGDILVA